MNLDQLLFGVFGGDMGALSVLFFLMLPLFLLLATFGWLKDKVTKR